MTLPGKRFWWYVPNRGERGAYAIVDCYLLPKGWYGSTAGERKAAIVHIEPYRGLSGGLDAYYHMISVLDSFNAGTRKVQIPAAAA